MGRAHPRRELFRVLHHLFRPTRTGTVSYARHCSVRRVGGGRSLTVHQKAPGAVAAVCGSGGRAIGWGGVVTSAIRRMGWRPVSSKTWRHDRGGCPAFLMARPSWQRTFRAILRGGQRGPAKHSRYGYAEEPDRSVSCYQFSLLTPASERTRASSPANSAAGPECTTLPSSST
jgi:hypothetical protein